MKSVDLKIDSKAESWEFGDDMFEDHTMADIFKMLPTATNLTSLSFLEVAHDKIQVKTIAQALPKTRLKSLTIIFSDICAKEATELAKALPGAKSLSSLNIEFNTIGDEGAKELAAVLPQTNLTSLNIASNNIGDKGVEALVKVLPAATSLTSLDISCNEISTEGIELVFNSLANATSLTSLKLECNKQNQPLNLDIGNDYIGDEEAEALAKVLPNAKNLTSLSLDLNSIGNKGARALAAVLPQTNLTSLSLDENRINYEGTVEILTIATNNPSFVTEIEGLINSDEINNVVATNRENLKKQAKTGALSLVDNHNFPTPIANIMAKYVSSIDIQAELMAECMKSSIDIKEESMPAIIAKFPEESRGVTRKKPSDDKDTGTKRLKLS